MDGTPTPQSKNLFGNLFSFDSSRGSVTSNKSGTQTTQKVFDQAAIDKLVYDVLSSERGLSSLAAGENLSGGFNSSAKTLETQDFLTKLIGELAVASAKEVTTAESSEKAVEKKSGVKTVICTELNRQGLLSDELYEAGGPPSRQVSYCTWRGYISWAESVVPVMARSPKLSRFFLPIVVARYEHLLGRSRSILGAATIYIGHPICWLIGAVITLGERNGRHSEFA